ncbi:MAG: hypothetical protein RIR00_1630 [Pseudomonadota bacterium]|jgi:hypothetical protein
MTDQSDIVFVSLAGNQSRFFQVVGESLARAGHGIFHVCFHEGAVRDLRAAGCTVFNPFERQPANANEIRFEDFGIPSPALLLGHEKAAYELTDTASLARKFKGHLAAMGSIIDELAGCGRPLCLVQELGGFTSVLAAYYAARRRGIDNWFIEPSFFRGRLFFTPNTFAAPKVPKAVKEASAEVRKIICGIVDSRTVVIPAKDRLHYRGASKKLLDPKNFRRLAEKLAAKHLRGEQEEFQYIGGHVSRHLRMFANSRKLSRHYQAMPASERFIYYPLHVPADFALTVRSPEYLDQYALIDYLCRVAPLGYRVVIKEHPAMVGAVSPERIGDLLARHDNFRVLSPALNNHDVLAAADAVVTVNSKSGAEALLHGTPVVVLGNAFYEDCPLVQRVAGLTGLHDALSRALDPAVAYDSEASLAFFQAVWDSSCPGELYDLTSTNVDLFADSLGRCLAK